MTPPTEALAATEQIDSPAGLLDRPAEQTPKPTGRARSLANLKRYPKGFKAPELTPGRVGPNRKSLERLITQALQDRSGERLKALARSIVQDAIDGDPASRNAARALLMPRLWPILDQQVGGQRTVNLGVRLELSKGSTAPTLTVVAQETTQPLPALSGELGVDPSTPCTVDGVDNGSHG